MAKLKIGLSILFSLFLLVLLSCMPPNQMPCRMGYAKPARDNIMINDNSNIDIHSILYSVDQSNSDTLNRSITINGLFRTFYHINDSVDIIKETPLIVIDSMSLYIADFDSIFFPSMTMSEYELTDTHSAAFCGPDFSFNDLQIPGFPDSIFLIYRVSLHDENGRVIGTPSNHSHQLRLISSRRGSYWAGVDYYNNCFSPYTGIHYSVNDTDFVSIQIYDILGWEVDGLVDSKQAPGEYRINWEPHPSIPPGVYFYVLKVGDEKTVKMLILD